MAFFERLKAGLFKTKSSFFGKIDSLFKSFVRIDEDFFEELEELLVCADVGVNVTMEILDALREKIKDERLSSPDEIKESLYAILRETIGEHEGLKITTKPSVILVIGVNGVGKTTSIGKMSAIILCWAISCEK